MKSDGIAKFGFGFHKLIGFVFIIFALAFLYISVPMLFDPETAVRFNGKETNEFTVKIFFVIFPSVFLVIGLFISVVKKITYEKLFIKNNKLLKLLSKINNNA